MMFDLNCMLWLCFMLTPSNPIPLKPRFRSQGNGVYIVKNAHRNVVPMKHGQESESISLAWHFWTKEWQLLKDVDSMQQTKKNKHSKTNIVEPENGPRNKKEEPSSKHSKPTFGVQHVGFRRCNIQIHSGVLESEVDIL